MFLNPWYAGQPGGQPDGGGGGALQGCERDEAGGESGGGSGVPMDPLALVQERLKCGWTAHTTQEGRLFYCK